MRSLLNITILAVILSGCAGSPYRLSAMTSNELKTVSIEQLQRAAKNQSYTNALIEEELQRRNQAHMNSLTGEQRQVEVHKIAAEVDIEYDEFDQVTRFTGPDLSSSKLETLIIRAWHYKKNNDTKFQIYISDYLDDWRFYDRAADSNGNRLELTKISSDVGSCINDCSVWETVGVKVSRHYLQSHARSGIRFKVSGSNGSEIFEIPSIYIQGILETVP